MVDCLNRSAERGTLSCFHLNEGNGSFPLHHEINVPVPTSEAPLYHSPAAAPKPPLRDSFSELPKRLPGH